MKYAALMASLKATGSIKGAWAMRAMAFVAVQQAWGLWHVFRRAKRHAAQENPSTDQAPQPAGTEAPTAANTPFHLLDSPVHTAPAKAGSAHMKGHAPANSPLGQVAWTKHGELPAMEQLSQEVDWVPAAHGGASALSLGPKRAAGELAHSALQRELSLSHEKMAAALMAQGDMGQALAHGQQSLAICIKLATSDPGNRDWQHDLMVSLNKVGEMWAAQGDHHQALRHGLQSLAISEQLAASEPADLDLHRDWSVSMNKVAKMWLAHGKRAQALELYQKSLALIEKLTALDPAHAQWQTDWVVSLVRLAQLEEQPLEKNALLGRALAVLHALQAQGALSEVQAQWMALIETEMAGTAAA